MSTLALYFNKGGVGKTATAVNLAYLSAQEGHKTLICDLDPQSSTSFYFRVKPRLKRRARGLVKWSRQVEDSIKGTDYPNLDLLPADFTHRNLDITFDRLKRRKHRLGLIIKPLMKEYDLVIMDCPPTINILAENIFNISDRLLVPLIPTPLSVHTFEQLLEFMGQNGYLSTRVQAFFSLVDTRKKIHRQIMDAFQHTHAMVTNNSDELENPPPSTGVPLKPGSILHKFNGILRTYIPYLSLVEQMGVYREPVVAFAPNSQAARAYQALWAEVSPGLFASS